MTPLAEKTMTPDERLAEALAAVDRARAARARAITDIDRDATWRDLNQAMAHYNECLQVFAA